MATIAVMTVSDGRPYVHLEIESFGLDVQQRIARALGGLGHRVVTATGDIHSNATAVAVARELAAARPDLTIVNVPVWAFPHFTDARRRGDPRSGAAVLQHRPAVPGHGRHAGRGRWPGPDRAAARAGVGRHRGPGRCCAGSTPSPAPGRRPPAAWLDVRPDRRAPDGHVHRGVRHRRLDAEVRHRRRGDRPV